MTGDSMSEVTKMTLKAKKAGTPFKAKKTGKSLTKTGKSPKQSSRTPPSKTGSATTIRTGTGANGTTASGGKSSPVRAAPLQPATNAKALGRENGVKALRAKLKMPQSHFARLLGHTERAVVNWEQGKSVPQDLTKQRLVEIERLMEELEQVISADAVGEWLIRPNPVFGDLKPIEVIERGRIDRIWRLVFDLHAGAHV